MSLLEGDVDALMREIYDPLDAALQTDSDSKSEDIPHLQHQDDEKEEGEDNAEFDEEDTEEDEDLEEFQSGMKTKKKEGRKRKLALQWVGDELISSVRLRRVDVDDMVNALQQFSRTRNWRDFQKVVTSISKTKASIPLNVFFKVKSRVMTSCFVVLYRDCQSHRSIWKGIH